MRPALLWVLMTALSAHASVYYVTVAGLGGEPDYEQRFTANAKDLDKLFKESGSSAHVYTLYRAAGDARTAYADARFYRARCKAGG